MLFFQMEIIILTWPAIRLSEESREIKMSRCFDTCEVPHACKLPLLFLLALPQLVRARHLSLPSLTKQTLQSLSASACNYRANFTVWCEVFRFVASWQLCESSPQGRVHPSSHSSLGESELRPFGSRQKEQVILRRLPKLVLFPLRTKYRNLDC